jgi:hypothetical protein
MAAVAARVPYLASSTALFNSDEAANALLIKHLLEGAEFRLYPWDATYYGILEGLIAIPFVWIAGLQPLAFKLAAVVGHLLLMVTTFLLGRRLFGPAEGLAAAGLLVLFSPRVLQWSALATGGLVLIVAWGSLTFLYFDRLRRTPTWWGWATFGLLAGFGLYLYELYLVYLMVIAIGALAGSWVWTAALADSPAERRAALGLAPRQSGAAVLFLAGLAIGWFPKLLAVAAGELGAKAPAYALAPPQQIAANLDLLLTRCIPSLLGANPAGAAELERWVGPTRVLSPWLGSLLLAAWAGTWLWELVRNRRNLASMLRRRPTSPGTESLLVLLVPVTALLFILSPNARDVHSDHYLLPWLTSLPLFAGALIVRAGRRMRFAAVGLLLVLVAIPAWQISTWYQSMGLVDQRLRLVRHRDSLSQVLDYLRELGIQGGYSWYWAAYKATFLSNEEIIVAPLWDWDRYPEYTRRVDRLATEAYIFEYLRTPEGERIDDRHSEFVRRLRRSQRPYEARRIGNFLVYTSPRRQRLLIALHPLTRPRAAVDILSSSIALRPGEVTEVSVRLSNLGDQPWSATGDAIGVYRVDLSYRWLKRDGTPIVLFEGERSLLRADLHPGESVEISARIAAPVAPGDYQLVLSPVQEGVVWFMDVGGGSASLPVRVGPPRPAS